MIRRISKNNDLKDVITSYPTTVIDNVKTIKYYVTGGEDYAYTATIEKKGDTLECVIPSSALKTMPNGMLYRKATYQVEDSSYPDGTYDLEMTDCLDVWLGEAETAASSVYLTADNVKTINGNSIVGKGDITIEGTDVTKTWVDEEIDSKTETALEGYATEEWVEEKGYLTEHQSLDDCLKKSTVNLGWNVTVNDSGSLRCTDDFTPEGTDYKDKNFASLGTVRNFYNACVKSTQVWTGTQTEWDALTDEQKASYTIALITE